MCFNVSDADYNVITYLRLCQSPDSSQAPVRLSSLLRFLSEFFPFPTPFIRLLRSRVVKQRISPTTSSEPRIAHFQKEWKPVERVDAHIIMGSSGDSRAFIFKLVRPHMIINWARAPTLAPVFHSFWKWAIISVHRARPMSDAWETRQDKDSVIFFFFFHKFTGCEKTDFFFKENIGHSIVFCKVLVIWNSRYCERHMQPIWKMTWSVFYIYSPSLSIKISKDSNTVPLMKG